MQKNIIIAVLMAIVIVMWLWPAKHQQPVEDALPQNNHNFQGLDLELNRPELRGGSRSIPFTNQLYPNQQLPNQGYLNQDGKYLYPSMPGLPYGNSYSQPQLYNLQPSRSNQTGETSIYPQTYPQIYPSPQPYTSQPYIQPQYNQQPYSQQQYTQQPYTADGMNNTPYYVPKFRFRDLRTESATPRYPQDADDNAIPAAPATPNPNWDDNQSPQPNHYDTEQPPPTYAPSPQPPERYLGN